MLKIKILILTLILLFSGGGNLTAADTAFDLNINVQSFTLDNGMLFLVVERPATQPVSTENCVRVFH